MFFFYFFLRNLMRCLHLRYIPDNNVCRFGVTIEYSKWLVYTVKILSLAGTFSVSCYSDVFELLYTTVSKTVCALHFLTTLCCERHKESTEIRMKRDHTGTDFFLVHYC